MIRIGVVDDHPVFRLGLVQILGRLEWAQLVVAAASVEQFDQLVADEAMPQVVVLDLQLPGVGGAEGVAHLRERGAEVLVVSAAAPQDHVLAAISAGAAGYLTKDAQPGEIESALQAVAGGGSYVSPTLASYLLQAAKPSQPDPLPLTPREREILALVAQGERDQDIAEHLFVSVRTVRSHLDRIRDKTGRRRRADLTRLALEEGVVPGPR